MTSDKMDRIFPNLPILEELCLYGDGLEKYSPELMVSLGHHLQKIKRLDFTGMNFSKLAPIAVKNLF